MCSDTGNSPPTTFSPPASTTPVFTGFQLCTATDIQKLITAAPSKSSELDPIPTDIMKDFLPDLLPFITKLCNASLSEGLLPTIQRHAVITPRLKKAGADQADVQNYRPISNLTFMSKVIELVAYLEEYQLGKHSLLVSVRNNNLPRWMQPPCQPTVQLLTSFATSPVLASQSTKNFRSPSTSDASRVSVFTG